jgi:outer membrane protein
MRHGHLARLGAAIVVAVSLTVPAARGETLTDALIRAYQTSPLLDASRAGLRGVDETVPQARAARRPQVSAFAQGQGTVRAELDPTTTDTFGAGLRANLLLFDSGQTRAAIESARSAVAAARADLRNVEQLVLFNAVRAFMDVRRDLEFVALAGNDVLVLEEQLRAAQDRFEVGEITRTDVSLTEARLAAARSTLAGTQGQLEVSRAAYQQAVGTAPGDLQPPPPLPQLPANIQEATAIGLQRNPEVVSAQFAERAALYDMDRARAAQRPRVQAQGTVDYQDASRTGTGPLLPSGRQRDVVGRAQVEGSVPLYEGGSTSSLIRQAQATLEQRQWQLQDAGRSVTQQVAAAWAQLEVARAQIPARRTQIQAARIAAEGIAEEARLGARSQLDVLDADQERLAAEADLVQAVRDEYVAAYNLLSAMGLLTVEHLGLGIETYDPEVNFMRVQGGPTRGYDLGVVDRIRSRWE